MTKDTSTEKHKKILTGLIIGFIIFLIVVLLLYLLYRYSRCRLSFHGERVRCLCFGKDAGGDKIHPACDITHDEELQDKVAEYNRVKRMERKCKEKGWIWNGKKFYCKDPNKEERECMEQGYCYKDKTCYYGVIDCDDIKEGGDCTESGFKNYCLSKDKCCRGKKGDKGKCVNKIDDSCDLINKDCTDKKLDEYCKFRNQYCCIVGGEAGCCDEPPSIHGCDAKKQQDCHEQGYCCKDGECVPPCKVGGDYCLYENTDCTDKNFQKACQKEGLVCEPGDNVCSDPGGKKCL